MVSKSPLSPMFWNKVILKICNKLKETYVLYNHHSLLQIDGPFWTTTRLLYQSQIFTKHRSTYTDGAHLKM